MSIGAHHQEFDLMGLDVRLQRVPIRFGIQYFDAGLDSMLRQMLRKGFHGIQPSFGLGFVLDHREDTNALSYFQERKGIRYCPSGLGAVVPRNRDVVERIRQLTA